MYNMHSPCLVFLSVILVSLSSFFFCGKGAEKERKEKGICTFQNNNSCNNNSYNNDKRIGHRFCSSIYRLVCGLPVA